MLSSLMYDLFWILDVEQVQKLHLHVSKQVLMKGLVVRSLSGAAKRDVIPQLE